MEDIRSVEPRPGRAAALAAEGLRYFLGALAGLAADWGAWTVLFLWTGMPVASQAAARAGGAAVAYAAFRRYAFAGSGARGAPVRFCAAAAASWALSVGLVHVLSGHLPAGAAKAGSDGITFCVNYFAMKLWVFPRGGKSRPGGTGD